MAVTIAIAEEKMEALEEGGKHDSTFASGVNILYSFDNANIHTCAVRAGMLDFYGWTEDDRLPLPPYSPDMHRVIEHTHGTATAAFRKWLYENPDKRTVDDIKAGFEQVYREVNTPDAIAKDVAGLPELYSWIHANGGEMAPRKMR
jgi:hypothetical protein